MLGMTGFFSLLQFFVSFLFVLSFSFQPFTIFTHCEGFVSLLIHCSLTQHIQRSYEICKNDIFTCLLLSLSYSRFFLLFFFTHRKGYYLAFTIFQKRHKAILSSLHIFIRFSLSFRRKFS